MNNTTGIINIKALLGATGIGLVVSFLLFLINAVSDAIKGPGNLGIGQLLCTSCLSIFGFLAIGMLYPWFAHRGGATMDTGKMALGGALAALVVAIMFSACRGCMLITGGSANEIGGLVGYRGALDHVNDAQVVGVNAVILCFTIIAFAGLGAGGGALNAMILRNRGKATAPVVEPPASPAPSSPQPPEAASQPSEPPASPEA